MLSLALPAGIWHTQRADFKSVQEKTLMAETVLVISVTVHLILAPSVAIRTLVVAHPSAALG
jgi:hypothetical protein